MAAAVKLLSKIVGKTLIASGYLVHCGCIAYCTLEYLGDFVICSGPSMEPTIFSNDVIFTEHISVLRRKVEKGDIIVARSPLNPKQYVCKRVKAVPGDRIRKGLLSETIPNGHVWLEGDNRNNSTDSRTYGPVPIGLLRGKAVCRVWPYEKAKFFSGAR